MAEKVVIALSGGVDSAVAAHKLVEAGLQVHAVYMKNWLNEEDAFGQCPWQEEIESAESVCQHLGITFEVVNFIRDYRERVVQYLVEGYARGITPNPDVMCNREMKFGVLLDWALQRGFDAVATGHYARVLSPAEAPAAPFPSARMLFEGVDKNKDQSYFLAYMSRLQLAHARFPIGHLEKPEVREVARKAGLPNAERKDSQGICFVGQVKIGDFLEQFIPDAPGEIVSTDGRILGTHRGLHRYTIGQRRGIGVPSNSDHNFFVVVGKEVENRRLVVDFEGPEAEGLWFDEMELRSLNWLIDEPIRREMKLLARVRYRDLAVPATWIPDGPDTGRVVFNERQRALAEGQFCALYAGEQLLAGGIFVAD